MAADLLPCQLQHLEDLLLQLNMVTGPPMYLRVLLETCVILQFCPIIGIAYVSFEGIFVYVVIFRRIARVNQYLQFCASPKFNRFG